MKNLHITKLKVVVLFFLVLGTITTVKAQETEMPNGEQILKYSWVAVDLNTCMLWDDSNHDLYDLGVTASWMHDFYSNISCGLFSGIFSRHGSFEVPLGVDLRFNMFTHLKANPFVGVKVAALIEAMPEGTRNDIINTLVVGSIGLRVNKQCLVGLDVNCWHLMDYLDRGHHSYAPYAALRLGWEF